jgi:hypothetical protein
VSHKISIFTGIIALIIFSGLIGLVIIWNISYNVKSYGVMLLRIALSVISYVLVFLCVAQSGLLVDLEQWLFVGSGAQNAMGLIAVLYYKEILAVSIVCTILKCRKIARSTKTGGSTLSRVS